MKKLIYGGLFLASVGILIVSCKKEFNPESRTGESIDNSTQIGQNINPELDNADQYEIPKNGFDSEFQLGNEGRFLVFNNENGYNHAVDNPSDEVRQNLNARMNNLNHYSWQNYVEDHPNQGLENLIDDDHFSSILSKDKTVQIGQHIYKISPENEKVYAIHVKDKKHYDRLLNNDEQSSFVRVFSFNDNVLEAIKVVGGGTGVSVGDNVLPAIFCGEGGVGGRDEVSTMTFNDKYGNEVVCNISCHYNRWGIYFSLVSYFDRSGPYQSAQFGLWIQVENRWFKPRCQSPQGPYSHPWRADNPVNNRVQRYRTYMASRALNGFHFKVRGRLEENDRPQGNNPYTTFFSDWVTICVNSTYC